MRIRGVLVGVLLLSWAGQALADKKSDAEAKAFYLEGTKYYNLGDFPKAIENYKKAYEKKPDAVFLYNVAQAYRLSNDFNQALFFYKSFLRSMPDAPNRAEVERRIGEMEDALAKQKAATAPPNGTVAPGETPPVDTTTGTTTDTTTGTTTDTTTDTTSTDTTVKVPGPDEVAEGSEAGQDNQTAPNGMVDTGGGKKPIYKKWWFWAGIGAVAVGTVAIIAASSGGGGGNSEPSSHFGATDVF